MRRVEADDYLADLAGRVIGACIEVHRHLGPGFGESVYEEALCVELGCRQLRFERQVAIAVQYKGVAVGYGRLDLLVEEALVVELKAVEALAPVHVAQVVAYLKATNHLRALLINFNATRLRDGLKRIVNTPGCPPAL